ncbi:unnamed protein product [marine sediment metagenome]|uniref:Uncharacterized protein n=1 Tax=marine sediment metagenome TaxID=412755 RepID=X1J979_9ZZZZ
MSKNNLTKKQIREASAMELVLRMDFLHALSASRPEDEGVPMADIQEAVEIDKEVKRKLKMLLPICVA